MNRLVKILSVLIMAVVLGAIILIYLHRGRTPDNRLIVQQTSLQNDFIPRSLNLTCAEREELETLRSDIERAVCDEHVKALECYMKVLCELRKDSDAATWENTRTRLCNVFDRSFLRCDPVVDFESIKEMDRYLNVCLTLAKFFGNFDVNRNNMEFAENKETLTYQRLRQIVKQCESDGRMEWLEVAEKHLKCWIEHIESSEGFALKAARFVFRFDMEFLPRTRPEVRVSQADALRHARSMAIGLIRCGYRPKWLDEFRDPSGKKDPWE